jgi:arginase
MKAPEAMAVIYVPADCGTVIPGKNKAPQAFQDVQTSFEMQV